MNFLAFAKDKWIFLLAQLLVLALICLVLDMYNVNRLVIFLMCFTTIIVIVTAVVFEYVNKAKVYKTLYKNLDALKKKYYISSMLEEPDFLEGKILADILAKTNKSMNDEIAAHKRLNAEYQDYIETWVHEIKTPISCIDLICENNPNKTTTDIRKELFKINSYVDQALYYARSTNVEKDYMVRKTELDSLIRKTIKKYSKELIAVKTKINLQDLHYDVFGDPKWLEFIIGQIITNSIKYRKNNLELSFSGVLEKDSILLKIEDNGIGIAANEVGRIFQKGFTGTNGRKYNKSTGIGLYLCKNLCDKMHLGIKAESTVGERTKITVIFPKNSHLLVE